MINKLHYYIFIIIFLNKKNIIFIIVEIFKPKKIIVNLSKLRDFIIKNLCEKIKMEENIKDYIENKAMINRFPIC
jgi:hypothetical protein